MRKILEVTEVLGRNKMRKHYARHGEENTMAYMVVVNQQEHIRFGQSTKRCRKIGRRWVNGAKTEIFANLLMRFR